jgi:predicted nuclease of predicted toxin-antitoxin system
MRFKCDENLPSDVTVLLLAAGHDAHSVLDEQMGGAPDSALARVCQDESRIFITLDLDFADIRNYPPQDYHGIIVLRPGRNDRDAILAIIPRVLVLLQTELIAGRLWIVDNHRTRIRSEHQ